MHFLQALEEQFPREEGYDIQYHKFNFKEYSDDPCLEIIVPPINESYLIGMVPTEPKVNYQISYTVCMTIISLLATKFLIIIIMPSDPIFPY